MPAPFAMRDITSWPKRSVPNQCDALGGWLRGLEICAGTVELDFSPQHAKILARPDLADYFANELKTLPPALAQEQLFEKIRAGINQLQPMLNKASDTLTRGDVTAIRRRARELDDAIRQSE